MRPIASGGVYVCPAGCMAVLGQAILESRACVDERTGESLLPCPI